MYGPESTLNQCEVYADQDRDDCLDNCYPGYTGCYTGCDAQYSNAISQCYQNYIDSMAQCDNQYAINEQIASAALNQCLDGCP